MKYTYTADNQLLIDADENDSSYFTETNIGIEVMRHPVSFFSQEIRTPQELATFVGKLTEPYRSGDEVLAIGSALSCRDDKLWRSPLVHEALKNRKYANENLRIVFNALASSVVDRGDEKELTKLLKLRNSHLLRARLIAHLLQKLHSRGALDVRQFLLPKLHWYTRAETWENAILVFRVCAPSLLSDNWLRESASRRSSHCKLLLKLWSAAAGDYPHETNGAFQEAVAELSKLDNKAYCDVILDIGWACLEEGPAVGSRVVGELVQLGDYRHCEGLIPFISKSGSQADLDTLTKIAACSNARAAVWAKAVLNDCGHLG